MNEPHFYQLRDALRAVDESLESLGRELVCPVGDSDGWIDRLRRNVLPSLDFELPVLLVAICGGGSTGKSTLFNTLAGERLSQVAFRAGLTSRVLLAGHPSVLAGSDVAQALLGRLPQRPEPWHSESDATTPGPPLYVAAEGVPRNLLLIDTPDFDTGDGGQLRNRMRAEPVLRTAEVIIYTFTNAVYNNHSNTEFMSDVVGRIGGRPTILVYRISRAATDDEVVAHSRVVAKKLFEGQGIGANGFPREIIGVYRIHESDAVALGQASPDPMPVGGVTTKTLPDLLASQDVAQIKRRVFAADLAAIARGATSDLALMEYEARALALYRLGLEATMAQEAVQALQSFPVGEAIQLVTEIFVESSPSYVKALRVTGRAIGAPMRGVRKLMRRLSAGLNADGQLGDLDSLQPALVTDLLSGASDLRNRLLDDTLIVRVAKGDSLARQATDGLRDGRWSRVQLEPVGQLETNVHIPVPRAVRDLEQALTEQDWDSISQTLSLHMGDLIGLPEHLEEEMLTSVQEFRGSMSWSQKLRETFFASLSTLPPILGVTYALLTADPVIGSGIWIQLEGVLGLNDLWALVSIPASVGLSERDRKQLEEMVQPVFQLWLQRRVAKIVALYKETVCRPVWDLIAQSPDGTDQRFGQVRAAINVLERGQ